jgi:transposase
MLTVGLDVHQKSSVLCVLDRHGKQILGGSIRGSWPEVVAELTKLERPFQVCYEASCGYGVLHDQLAQRAKRVVVAHPGQLRLIFRSKQKNDRVDARKLATLLYLDQVPPVYVPAADIRGWRGLIEHRRRLVERRTKAKNGLRAALRTAGIHPKKGGHWLWTCAGLAWLAAVDLPSSCEAVRRDALLSELEHFRQQIQRVTRELDRLAAGHPAVHLLRTIPGVGPRTAEAVVAYIDDPRRFTRIRSVGSYFGLTPCQDQSASRNRLGHITKNGPSTVRRLLVEAAWQSIRRSDQARAYFERLLNRKPERRKIAIVGVAHKLLRIMLAMLRSGEVCRWSAAA